MLLCVFFFVIAGPVQAARVPRDHFHVHPYLHFPPQDWHIFHIFYQMSRIHTESTELTEQNLQKTRKRIYRTGFSGKKIKFNMQKFEVEWAPNEPSIRFLIVNLWKIMWRTFLIKNEVSVHQINICARRFQFSEQYWLWIHVVYSTFIRPFIRNKPILISLRN